jgi:hypothetical protein
MESLSKFYSSVIIESMDGASNIAGIQSAVKKKIKSNKNKNHLN